MGRLGRFEGNLMAWVYRFEFCRPRGQSIRRCMSVFWQLVREKSLVPKCFGIRRNSPDISKGIFQNDICRFESYMPSQPVRSLRCDFRVCAKRRHSRGLLAAAADVELFVEIALVRTDCRFLAQNP